MPDCCPKLYIAAACLAGSFIESVAFFTNGKPLFIHLPIYPVLPFDCVQISFDVFLILSGKIS